MNCMKILVPPLFIGNSTLLTHSSQIGTSYSGNVHIKGDFVVDNTFRFINCIIKIDPGVTIYVQSPNSLIKTYLFVIDNSKLFACNNMWKGIVLSTNTSIMTLNQTVIEDAQIAIKAEDIQYCALFIESTTFNRNDIGIFLSHTTNISHPAIIYRLSNNTFKCTAPLNGTVDQIGSAGIHLENNQILSVNPILQSHTNKFIGLFRGIFANGFSTIINGKRLIFERCKYSGITLQGVLNLEACQFRDCGYAGIDLQSVTNVKLRSCSFNFTEDLADYGFQAHRFGIFVYKLNPGGVMSVSNCSFNASLVNQNKNVVGIYCVNASVGAGARVSIYNNIFDYLAAYSFGVYVKGNYPSDSHVDIFDNVFDIQQVHNGFISFPIACVDGNKYNIDIIGNTFKNDGIRYDGQEGVYLRGSEGTGHEFSDNQFPLPHVLDNFIHGLRVENFDKIKFCSNSFYNTLGAFYFIGQNDEVDFVANDVHVGNILEVEEFSWLDDQNQKGNLWYSLPLFPFVANPQALNKTPDYAQWSQFMVHTAQSTSYSSTGFNPYHPVDIVPDVSDEWWKRLPGSPAPNCLTEQPPGGGATKLKKDIANNAFENIESNPSLVWQAKRGLYKTLKNNPDLISTFASFSQFISTHNNSTIGKLFNVGHKIDSTLISQESLLLPIAEGQNIVDSLLIELFFVDSLLEIQLDSVLEWQKSDIISQLSEITSDLDITYDLYQDNVSTALNSIKLLNNNISTSFEWEKNEKEFYGIYIDKLRGGVLREGQIDTLRSIAQKCPQSGGMAVYFARGILSECSVATLSDYNNDCFSSEAIVEVDSIQTESAESTTSVLSQPSQISAIYPNPTFGEIQIVIASNSLMDVTITNSLGMVMSRHQIKSSQYINVNSLEPGVYYATVRLDGKTITSHRFIVMD